MEVTSVYRCCGHYTTTGGIMQEKKRILQNLFQFGENSVQITGNRIGTGEQITEQIVQVFFKMIGQAFAPFPAKFHQPLLAGMGLTVQGKQYVKIGFQKSRGTVVDADQISPFQGFVDLQLICRKLFPEQAPATLKDGGPQRFGIGNVKAFLCSRKTAAAVKYNFAGQQVVSHTGGVGIVRIALLHHIV